MKYIYRTETTNDISSALYKFGVTDKVIISILQQEIICGPLRQEKIYEYIVVYKENVEEVVNPLVEDRSRGEWEYKIGAKMNDRDTNLLEETEKILKDNGKTLDDIYWWGTRHFEFPKEKLRQLLNVQYDSGYGGQEILPGLILVGVDFWLTREEYDGKEWWRFNAIPRWPLKSKDIETLKVD